MLSCRIDVGYRESEQVLCWGGMAHCDHSWLPSVQREMSLFHENWNQESLWLPCKRASLLIVLRHNALSLELRAGKVLALRLFSPGRWGVANLAAAYSKLKNPNKSYGLQCCLGRGQCFGVAITSDSRRVMWHSSSFPTLSKAHNSCLSGSFYAFNLSVVVSVIAKKGDKTCWQMWCFWAIL